MKVAGISRKTLFCLFMTLSVCLSIPETILGQSEKLGVVNYTPPPGWTKTPKENVVAFSVLDQSTGGFCIITVYGATPSVGSPNNDFTKEWGNLVVNPLRAEANPQTEMKTLDGWTLIAGAAAVDFQGGKALAFLTVFSGFGKTASVLSVFNEQSYATQAQAFIESIRLDKTPAASPPATGNGVNNGPPNATPGKLGPVSYAKPSGWSEQVFQDGVVFKPSDLPAGEHLAMQIMPPLNASGTLEQALQQSYDEAAAMYKATRMHSGQFRLFMINADGTGERQMTSPPGLSGFPNWGEVRGGGPAK